ncbi:TetR/AcrR family transcriptional regulator [Metabacillus arenae]|uniref:TetR/AcrR family transcriptional regulator n=1 Tax=Metabacillus arenae TaxID=2771434 RepID=A0A926RW46_9BACI|nr:TetR/AcrR family transcriptional regulator [Metabacillus arenae]MBD1379561.1 TetR/AcrR family transcriptional regulator [Metabacillus arenae]
MKEKEKLIIESAMKLFAKKGISSTPIQEIASEAGISKGAFYLYFKSKEALIFSIFKYYFGRIHKKMNDIEKEGLSARETFVKQLACYFSEIESHREFIIMQHREHAIPINKEIGELLQNMRLESIKTYRNNFEKIYGDKVKPFILDLTIILQGIVHSYLELIMFKVTGFNHVNLSKFILNRCDDLVEGLLSSEEKPVLPPTLIEKIMLAEEKMKSTQKDKIVEEIEMLKSNYSSNPDYENITVTLDVLKEEIQLEKPRVPVIQGMLSNFEDFPELKDFKQKIISLFEI